MYDLGPGTCRVKKFKGGNSLFVTVGPIYDLVQPNLLGLHYYKDTKLSQHKDTKLSLALGSVGVRGVGIIEPLVCPSLADHSFIWVGNSKSSHLEDPVPEFKFSYLPHTSHE